ncbi:hypothetical protein ACJMK2_012014 [Sinanodonta woodiana]|uniref:Bicaudal D-related protein 1 n=1 Tax=Sinanodonta woodiana TaxID=1069815 RepID=A0ABD3V6U3_SINWO
MHSCSFYSLSSSPTAQDLDEYVLLMANRRTDEPDCSGEGSEPQVEEEDLKTQLDQKEKDLMLAAELGKALLERNQELERRSEQLTEEYNQKYEELEQEKHQLHLKLENLETEYVNTVKELQYDLTQLRHEMSEYQKQMTSENKEKSRIIRELSQQNEKLVEEAQQASVRQDAAVSELEFAKERGRTRRSSSSLYLNQLEILQDEVYQLTQRRDELERRLSQLSEEKESFGCSLEEAQDRMMVLERSKRELEQEVHNQKIEILELQETTSQLTAQIEHLTERASTGSGHSQTLYNELSMIGGNNCTTDMAVVTDTDQQLPADHSTDDEIECDDDDFPMFSPNNPAMSNQSLFQQTLSTAQIRDEILYVYNCIQEICREVRQHMEADVDIDQFGDSYGAVGGESKTMTCHLPNESTVDFKRENNEVQENHPDHPADSPHILSLAIEKLRKHIGDLIAFNKQVTAKSCSTAVKESLEEQIKELQCHMRHTQDVLQQSHVKVEQKEMELQKKDDLLREFQDKLLEYQDLISRLNKERDDLQNKKIRSLKFDAVVMQMRKERDEAFDRKNRMELQLSQTKLDLLTLNSQLMEAIHQKIGISQQLDQWQLDMEELLDVQMQKRIQEQLDKEQIIEQLKQQLKSMKSAKAASSFLKRH